MTTPDEPGHGRLFLITGAQASGKSTVAKALAEVLPRSVFIDGDELGGCVVNGRRTMTNPPETPAVEQLFLRYAASLTVADVYRSAGFDAIVADNVYGEFLTDYLDIAAPETVHLVMLHPSVEALQTREDGRRKKGYRDGFTVESIWHAVEEHTPRLGLWIDNSDLSVEDTVTRIVQQADDAVVIVESDDDDSAPSGGPDALDLELDRLLSDE